MVAHESSPSLAEIERRMRPGVFTRAGYLGADESLQDVLREDAETLMRLHVRATEIAQSLSELVSLAAESTSKRARIDDYMVILVKFKGFPICPFAPRPHEAQCDTGTGVRFGSFDWRIRDRRSARELHGPGLLIHLIGDHAFFEGHASPHRIEPQDLATFLGLGKPEPGWKRRSKIP